MANKPEFNSTIGSNRKVYVATGILNSLSYENMPTQAEITDLLYILSHSPYAIILNYGVVRSDNMSKAITIVDRISNSLITRALSSES